MPGRSDGASTTRLRAAWERIVPARLVRFGCGHVPNRLLDEEIVDKPSDQIGPCVVHGVRLGRDDDEPAARQEGCGSLRPALPDEPVIPAAHDDRRLLDQRQPLLDPVGQRGPAVTTSAPMPRAASSRAASESSPSGSRVIAEAAEQLVARGAALGIDPSAR